MAGLKAELFSTLPSWSSPQLALLWQTSLWQTESSALRVTPPSQVDRRLLANNVDFERQFSVASEIIPSSVPPSDRCFSPDNPKLSRACPAAQEERFVTSHHSSIQSHSAHVPHSANHGLIALNCRVYIGFSSVVLEYYRSKVTNASHKILCWYLNIVFHDTLPQHLWYRDSTTRGGFINPIEATSIYFHLAFLLPYSRSSWRSWA